MASGRTLQSTIEISGVLSPSLRSAIDNAVNKLNDMAEETLDSADAASRLAAEMDAQEDILRTLQKAYAGYAVEGKESSEEAQQLAKRIQDVSGELNENKQKLSAAERAADSFGEELEDAGQAAEKSSEGYTMLGDVLSDLATDAIKNAMEGLKDFALEGDKALAMLEARTGTSKKEMEGYKDVMYEVYNDNYGESLGDVSEKLSTVIQMTDNLDNASLAKVTKNAIALEDVFGFDTVESMRAVNSLMDQFGITSDQAFNLLVQGAQKGLNQNDDLLDTINEYSVQFRTAGYSADEMFNMLANGAESGTWSVDKLGDAVKEFNIRASDGTVTDAIKENAKSLGLTSKQAKQLGAEIEGGSVEAYQKLLEKLYEVDDESKRYQLGVAMFGTMWEDLGEDTVASLMKTEGAIDSTNDAMQKMDTAAYDTLESKLESINRKFKGAGQIALGSISAITLLAMHWDDLSLKMGQAKTNFSKFGTSISTAFGGITAPVWAVIAVVAVLAAAFVSLWKKSETFRNNIIGIWEGIKSKFEAFGQGIVDRLNALGFDFENFTEVVKAIWDGFCNFLAPVFEGVFQAISNVLSVALDTLTGLFDIFAGIFTGNWDMVWQGIKEVFGAAWDFIANTFSNVLNTLKGVADVFLGWFGTSWEAVWGSVKSFFVDTWNSITSFLSKAWEIIKSVVMVGIQAVGGLISAAFQIITIPFRFIWENCKGIIISAWNSIKNAVSTALNAIKNIISSVWNAIKAVITPIVSAIANFLTTAWNSIKNSVSSALNAIKSVATSAWNGIKSTISNAVNGAKNLVSSAFNSMKAVASSAFNGIKGIATSAWNGIKSAISTPINAAVGVVKGAIERMKAAFKFSWKLPDLKLPHISVSGGKPPYGIAGRGSLPKFSIKWYKDGGILTDATIFGMMGNTMLGGGEAGAEAVVPLKVLWEKLERMIHEVFNAASSTGAPSGEGLTATAGKLLTLEDFSLGSLADSGGPVIYYDFSGFTWSPQIHANGSGDGDDIMAKLKAHEAEFFDWLEEFVHMREEAQYA